MIQTVYQGDHRYKIYASGEDIGCIAVSQNPYHNRHSYLDLRLTRYDPQIAAELFRALRQELHSPLQVMLYASESMHNFLIAGGFERRRRCYALEAHAADLAIPLEKAVPLARVSKGTAEYDLCRKMLYDYYGKTHFAVSPLTADMESFCADLPDTVLCHMERGRIVHFAFVEPEEEGYEIAYVGSVRPADFKPFAQSLVATLFRKCDLITAECDDVDPAAMALKALFRLPDGTPYDTYILDGS